MSVFQDKDVKAEITREGGGVALPRSPVTRERETVMARKTGAITMVMRGARET